jgi:hypothetical protein
MWQSELEPQSIGRKTVSPQQHLTAEQQQSNAARG